MNTATAIVQLAARIAAEPGDQFAYLAFLFVLGLIGCIMVFWARRRIKGR